MLSSLEQHLFTGPPCPPIDRNSSAPRVSGVPCDHGSRLELADVQRKSERLLVEDGHADPGVAGRRLNELAAQKRDIGGELSLRRDETLKLPTTDGASR